MWMRSLPRRRDETLLEVVHPVSGSSTRGTPCTETDHSLESVCEQLEALTDRVAELEGQLERKDDRIEELEAELTEYKRFAGSEFANVRGRITDVEDQTDELETTLQETPTETTTVDAEENGSQPTTTETPLERICTLPEHVADRELTTNQKRARFIARDVQDYAEKAPAGLVLDSQTIAKVITAAEGSKPHTQTVARVMDFLEKLGKDDVEQTKRRGKKLVVVEEEAADRYHDRCDRDSEQAPAESVMS
jgi:chromosome segregation ATPase